MEPVRAPIAHSPPSSSSATNHSGAVPKLAADSENNRGKAAQNQARRFEVHHVISSIVILAANIDGKSADFRSRSGGFQIADGFRMKNRASASTGTSSPTCAPR
jgi:hypothetical protein